MASTRRHDRRRAELLLKKILDSRDEYNYPSLTLLLDTVSQSAKPVIKDFVHRAKKQSETRIIFLSLETSQRRAQNLYALRDGEDEIILGYKSDLSTWIAEVKAAIERTKKGSKAILLIDSLNEFTTHTGPQLPRTLLSLSSPSLRILGTYHTDVPPLPQTSYHVSPLKMLTYIATTTFTLRSVAETLAGLEAEARSRAKPGFGLEEGVEGVLQGVGANGGEGVVGEMEHKRKSGTVVAESYVFPCHSQANPTTLAEYLEVNDLSIKSATQGSAGGDGGDLGSTMDLNLTAQQRRDREGVVLPHFDAQKGEGGEGGRILYDMGAEDDFDEEEDEI